VNAIYKWFNKRYPQNYIIKNPLIGSLVFLVFCICFVIIYKPLQMHESRFFNYEVTVAIYCFIVAIPLFGLVKILKSIRYFSNSDEWTVLKEILSVVLSLLGMGIAVYFSGFLLEPPFQRWNLPTFFDSLFSAFLIFAVPLSFFSLINYRYLLVSDIIKQFTTETYLSSPDETEELIMIDSQLKKEELFFYPNQFLYAESDGNYIVFHLNLENQIKKKTIRNSISNVEQQLSAFPYLFRTHRAYIVNIRKVSSQKGNTLGYRLKLAGTDIEIPVSRQKTRDFDQILKRFH
jgi:plasmid stabilization system protein ParE